MESLEKLISEFFSDIDEKPYKNALEERRLYLDFVDMLLYLSLGIVQNAPDIMSGFVGIAFKACDDTFYTGEDISFYGREKIREIFRILLKKSSLSPGLPISELFMEEHLEPVEMLAFLLAFASDANRKYENVFETLSGADNEKRPTCGICHDIGMLFLSEGENDISILLRSDSYLNRILLEPSGGVLLTKAARPLVLGRAALSYACGINELSGDVKRCAYIIEPAGEEYTAREEEYEKIKLYLNAALKGDNGGIIELCATCGNGRRYLLGKLCRDMGCNIIAADVNKLLALDGALREKIVSDICIKALLFKDMVYFYGVDDKNEDTDAFLSLLTLAKSYIKAVIIGSEKPLNEKKRALFGNSYYLIEFPEADISEQKMLWQQALIRENAVFSEQIDMGELISKYVMTPGRIFAAVSGAVVKCRDNNDDKTVIEKSVLEEQIRMLCAVRIGENAKRLSSPFVWDDLIVAPESERLLKIACDRIRYKTRVNEDFGFGKKLPYGRGVAITLYGPPGTGKTMAAQVLARELGLDIYRIDMAQISSKYIGETEKNLSLVFDAAKNSNAILFFDEADSLFSKRTEVNSSNDKYANAETAFLLQKIEEYSGLSILATNNLQNFDNAFKRRMTFLIPIGIPDLKTREALWKAAFPPEAPLGADVDFAMLAKAAEIAGSNIKNIAIAAAYTAAAQKHDITMKDIAEAADIECVKCGMMGVKDQIYSAMI